MLLDLWQAWCHDHFPEEFVPGVNHYLHDEPFPNVQSELLLMQLDSMVGCSVTSKYKCGLSLYFLLVPSSPHYFYAILSTYTNPWLLLLLSLGLPYNWSLLGVFPNRGFQTADLFFPGLHLCHAWRAGFFCGCPNLCSPSNPGSWTLPAVGKPLVISKRSDLKKNPPPKAAFIVSRWKVEVTKNAQSSQWEYAPFPLWHACFSACIFISVPASFNGLSILLFLKVLVFFRSLKQGELSSSDLRAAAEKSPLRAVKQLCFVANSLSILPLFYFSLWFNGSHSRR